jgi:hypothetical protein
MSVKIAVGMIVLNGDFVLKECLEQIYPHVSQILIAEGPVKFWQERGVYTSTDNTNNIIDNFYDPDSKIKVVHGMYSEKKEQSNSYMKLVNPDIDYIWQIDSDEVYRTEDIIKIKEILKTEKPTSMGVRSCSFYGGFNNYLTGFELNNDNFLRIFKYENGVFWKDHRPPTMDYKTVFPKKHIDSDTLFNKWGVQMYHYSYVFPRQVKEKTNYYKTFTNNGSGIIPNYFEAVYLNWVYSDENRRLDIENKYRGVHEFIPSRRGDCYTAKFKWEHPEAISRNMEKLEWEFNKQKYKVRSDMINNWKNEDIPKLQLELNIKQINDRNNYPQHWINLLSGLENTKIDKLNKVFIDIACGIGTTSQLLKHNNVPYLYFGYDFSPSMIETAKNTWQNESFEVKDLFTFEKMDNNNNNIIYADGILDLLINSAETLKYILSLNAEYVILNRINISDKTGYSIYKAYNIIDCVNFRFEENFLNQLINDGSYSIINKISNQYNLFILKNNKF